MGFPFTFTTEIQKINSALWNYVIFVPENVSQFCVETSIKRLVCTLNDEISFQCALTPYGNNIWYIHLSAKIRKQLSLKEGSKVSVNLVKDTSEYGLPMPEEFREVLYSDEEGNQYFHALTPGKQRSLLYIAANVKSIDLRIKRAIVIIEHLKMMNGKIDFKKLNQMMKSKNN
ncbi:MAG: YdeI/OmpD-associated family protein [Bacteroidota bacterium]|nr:YdeI/OmpD-associated family protein [Bacteroidota bacterium]